MENVVVAEERVSVVVEVMLVKFPDTVPDVQFDVALISAFPVPPVVPNPIHCPRPVEANRHDARTQTSGSLGDHPMKQREDFFITPAICSALSTCTNYI